MKLSSYNIKCLVIYVIYCLLVFFVEPGNFFNDDVKDAVLLYIAIPLIVYLLLPFVLKFAGNWKIVRWLDGVIDYIYKTIKEPDKQHEFQKESLVQTSDSSTSKADHWIWKVIKVVLWIAILWGILILIYVIPGLGVPVAALAGYIGVKMTKKEDNK